MTVPASNTPTPTEDPVENPEDPKGPENQDLEAGKSKEPKTVPLSDLIKVRNRAQEAEAKLKAFEDAEAERQRGEMTEIDRLKADLQKTTEENTTIKVSQAKANALAKAKAEIGEGWSVEHAEKSLESTVGKLVFDPKTIDADVKEIVEAAKRQRTAGGSSFAGVPAVPTGPSGAKADINSTSPAAQLKLSKENPEEFAQLQKEQRAAARTKWLGGR